MIDRDNTTDRLLHVVKRLATEVPEGEPLHWQSVARMARAAARVHDGRATPGEVANIKVTLAAFGGW